VTLHIISDNTKIGNGIQVPLAENPPPNGNGDDVFVTAGVTVASQTAVAIVGFGNYHMVNVQGTVIGEDGAIALGGSGKTGQSLVIGEDAYVGNIIAPNAAVVINGSASTVDNAGIVHGQTRALEFQGGSNGDVSLINNSGLIEAGDFAIVHAASSNQVVVLNNIGEIRATNTLAGDRYSYHSSGAAPG
jgi:hypothetical protein